MKISGEIPANTMMNKLSTLITGYDFVAAKEDAAASYTSNSTILPSEMGTSGVTTQTTDDTPKLNEVSKIDVSGVRGSMTIAEAAQAVGLSEMEFYHYFGLNASLCCFEQISSYN